ncbi:MAG TPA: glycosyltransferase family 39 protein [Candidatus Limnocylindrales bacterium]|nr:glycosyltransferase family 39 protein [Candidatus Limnocylindrales bacterium]
MAKSIASGHGFSSPLPGIDTGPTAWFPPAYPFFLAGIFRLCGIYSVKSHIISQAANCLFVSLAIFAIHGTARRSFGIRVATIASWTWAFLPSAVHIPIAYVWDTALTAAWLMLMLWATLVLKESRRSIAWAAYGGAWAMAAMINPSLLMVLPGFLGWLAWEGRQRLESSLRNVAIALIVLLAGMAPWTVRNYHVFGKFVPVRSVFGITLWEGNNPVAVGVDSFRMLPVDNAQEAKEYQRVGEIEYAKTKQKEALVFMRSHPGTTMHLVLGRIATFWLEASDRANNVWSRDPFYVKGLLALNALMTLFCLFGVITALSSPHSGLGIPYAVVLLCFPLLYYVAYASARFRFPMEPVEVILAVYGVARILGWAQERQIFALPGR